MADYALECPKCGSAMWDQQAPGNTYPWKPGRPIAVCKNKKKTGCDGVYWEDSKALTKPLAQAPTRTAATPQPKAEFVQVDIEGPKPKAIALQSMPAACAEYVELAYTLALNLNKAIQECREGDDQPTADLLGALGNEFQAAVATVYIEMNKRAR